jgi:glucose-6-phosphate 1-dehydrogenase
VGREHGASETVELFACKDPSELMAPYDRLLSNAMAGEPSLFARQDEVETAWSIVDPILKKQSPLYEYEADTWGPAEAAPMLASFGGWHDPR